MTHLIATYKARFKLLSNPSTDMLAMIEQSMNLIGYFACKCFSIWSHEKQSNICLS